MSNTKIILESITTEELVNELVSKVQTVLAEQPKEDTDKDKLLSRAEVTEMLQISLVTLWNWTNKGILIAHRLGNKIFYKKHEILNALQEINNATPKD